MPKLQFPTGFLWGAATSAHQVEGHTHNDWSEWEKKNATRLAEESHTKFGHLPHWERIRSQAEDPNNYISGQACDHYRLFESDFDLAQTLHHNAHRFSIEWSRIEPTEGIFDEKEIEHYRAVLHALTSRNIEPFVTLWHWTLPLWLADKGGVTCSQFPQYFERYTEKIVTALGSDVRFWITLNEPDVMASHAYIKGVWPPEKKNVFCYYRALKNLIAAHTLAYQTIKKHSPDAQIGIAKHQVVFETARQTFVNRFLKTIGHYLWNRWLLDRIKNYQDFIGLNHYNRNVIDNGFYKQQNAIQTDIGWEYWPDAIYQALIDLKPYGRPIYVIENGIADAKDRLRAIFIRMSLSAIHRAIKNGADVRGYFYWSLLDNFEWDKGFWPRFGLVAIDYATQERTIRKSALVYAKICESNSLEID